MEEARNWVKMRQKVKEYLREEGIIKEKGERYTGRNETGPKRTVGNRRLPQISVGLKSGLVCVNRKLS